jgi:hypothetical protein
MDDPLVPKRLDEAITIVRTCMDMCPMFEGYRRERQNNLFTVTGKLCVSTSCFSAAV